MARQTATLPTDPVEVMRAAGQEPDEWQAQYLRSTAGRELLCCARGVGKTRATAARTLHRMLTRPDYRCLFFSPTQRQSTEILAYLYEMWYALGRPLAGKRRAPQEAATSLKLVNGSRVLSLPDNQRGVRGFHVDELVLDEASQISDALYMGARPMILRRQGTMTALSTPYGKRGWFWDEWDRTSRAEAPWQTVKVTAEECGRYTTAQLAEERRSMGERWYRQEYECSFEEAIDSVFSQDDINAALSQHVEPLHLGVG